MSSSKNIVVEMDMSLSPSMSTQCPENLSPKPIKTIYSKLISSCKRSEGISCSVTPDNKEEFRKIVSPFVSKQVPFNPFNHNLKERLENPIFSPGVFSTVISPSRDSEEFKWTIDDLSKIKPAHIEEEFHFEEITDEQTETEMQKTIDKYFKKNHMIPSPWDCKLPTSWQGLTEIFKKENKNIDPAASMSSPCSFSLSHLELVSKTPCQNVSTQTALSLPPNLPETINSALKPYFVESDMDEINLSMNSLRRKLFCQNDDEPYSPVRFVNTEEVSPMLRSCYPSTPVISNLASCSPVGKFSPVDVSPIKRIGKSSTCNNSSYMMQVDSSMREMRSTNMITSDSIKMDQTNDPYGEECCKVFESPKLAGVIRRNRKRRRSISQDMNMSISYSSFTAKQCTKQTIHMPSSCGELRTFTESSTTDNFILSQDTGYGSECTNTEKSRRISNVNFETTTFECWNKENKENILVASTPTK